MKIIGAFLILASSSLFAQTALNPSELLNDIIQDQKCVAIAAGLSIDGTTQWSDASGYRDLEQKLPFEVNTKNRIASISKPMTAIAILQLMELGHLALNDPIVKYLPHLPETYHKVTIQQLLGHTSGVSAYKSSKEQQNKKEYASLEAAANIFINRKLLFEPGSSFHYTTYGYTLLGMIIEKVSKMSYEAYLQKNIWNKAGMKDTGVEDFGVEYPNKSLLYHINSKGKIKVPEPTNLSDRIPGGGIYSTTEDLLKLGNAILTHQLITKETQELMIKNHGLKTKGNGYGMGWYLYGLNPKHGNVFGHNGAQIGSSAFLLLLPEKRATVVAISNTSGALETTFNVCLQLFNLIE